jgi:heterodisulfide reductase subunit C/nitrate reductase gamma subunit
MFFISCLYISLAVFAAGVLFKMSTWFRYNLDTDKDELTSNKRISAAVKGIASTVFSAGILTLLKVFLLDVILQVRVFKEDILRWVMHMLIYAGFTMLLLMHALDKVVTVSIFPDYYSTATPFFFLRDFFGAMVFAGLSIAVYRRFVRKVPRLKSEAMDIYAIVILAVIMVSGFLLEGAKITSYSAYNAMVEDYAGTDDAAELAALESVWVRNFSVVSPNTKGPFDEDVIEQGLEIHGESCADCHSPPQWAFGGFLTAKALGPAALALDKMNFSDLLWTLHFLACFIGLAYLPFSKMFHVIATPISILVNAVMDRETSAPANITTRQIMELDACTRCGTCSLNCSVAFSSEEISNLNILPSIKIKTLKAAARENNLDRQAVSSLQEGLYLCTNCYRCTMGCPSSINLQDLWFNTREAFLEKTGAEPAILSGLSYHRGLNRDRIEEEDYQKPVIAARKAVVEESRRIDIDGTIGDESMDLKFKTRLSQTLPGDTSNYCFACTTCTATCPVVRNFDNPAESLGMMPHQMIRAANLGLGDMIFESTMLWSCLGCYACQENCPQGVRITDLFYELKNLAMISAKERRVGVLS